VLLGSAQQFHSLRLKRIPDHNVKLEGAGGVLLFNEEQFITINGFSNMHWGWDATDDDLNMRVLLSGK